MWKCRKSQHFDRGGGGGDVDVGARARVCVGINVNLQFCALFNQVRETLF